jgi:lipoic acid synthetase
MRDLLEVGVSILTLGQYLRPSPQHLPVARYYHPDEFAALAAIGRDLGFAHVESGPLVRSSYHAKRQADSARTEPVVAGTEPRPSMSGRPRPEPASRHPLQ